MTTYRDVSASRTLDEVIQDHMDNPPQYVFQVRVTDAHWFDVLAIETMEFYASIGREVRILRKVQ